MIGDKLGIFLMLSYIAFSAIPNQQRKLGLIIILAE